MGLAGEVNKSKQVAFDSPDNKNDQIVLDCQICLDLLANKDDERNLVKLRCGHEFHLDCIGSSFNAKNKMECPLCRQIEQGQWLYAQPQHNNPSMRVVIHQIEENLARLRASERRLHGMVYGYYGISGGTSTEHGESSGAEVVTGEMVETIATANSGDTTISGGCDCGCEDYEQF